MTEHADVVIVGGGVVGSSIAYHLRCDGLAGRVVVAERDPTYARASSNLAMGGIRQQFTTPANVRMARYSVAFYLGFDERMRLGEESPAWFRQRGYLFLATADNAAQLERRFARQRELGVSAERWDVARVQAALPDLVVDDVLFAIFGPSDGYANPKRVLALFRAGADRHGAEFVTGEATAIERSGGRVSAITLGGGGTSRRIETPVVVNAAGAWAAEVARLVDVELPVRPVPQQLFRCRLPHRWPYRFPMVIDHDGMHWRHDDPVAPGDPDRIVVGRADPGAGESDSLDADPARWMREVQPILARRMPALATAQLEATWAGLYEMTPDHNAVIGEHPAVPGFYLANGFSGHGLMMAPATGKAVADLIRLGRSDTVDVSPFRVDRFERGELILDDAML